MIAEKIEAAPSARGKILAFPELREKEKGLEIGFIDNPRQADKAAQVVADGGIVVAQLGNIYGIFLDADNDQAIRKQCEIKGKTSPQPLSVMMSSSRLLDILDIDAIHSDLKHIAKDANTMRQFLGGVCHIRGTVNKSLMEFVPDSILSKDDDTSYIHSLDPHGYPEMEEWVKKVNDLGVRFVGVSSLNYSGSPEIYSLPDAIDFCLARHGVNTLLIDSTPTNPQIRGSYAILDINKSTYIRDGQIPVAVIDEIIGANISATTDPENLKQHKYDQQFDFQKLLESGLTGPMLREAVLSNVRF